MTVENKIEYVRLFINVYIFNQTLKSLTLVHACCIHFYSKIILPNHFDQRPVMG